MNYNPLIDLALMGAALILVGIIISKEPKVRRGAEPMSRELILMFQKYRREDNDLD